MATLAGCGSGPSSTAPVPPTIDAVTCLLHLDDLPLAGFAVVEAPHRVGTSELVAGDRGSAAALRAAGLIDAARAHYFRSVVELDVANGPVDVLVDCARFPSTASAQDGYLAQVARRDRQAGASPLSTGPIGEQAHGDESLAVGPGNVPVVEATVTLRIGSVVSSVVVRGRQGGTGIRDAVELARRQASRIAAP